MRELFIGVMSGTSMDAIDVALVDFNEQPFKLLATYREAIPQDLKTSLGTLCFPSDDEINRLGMVDQQVGHLFAKAVNGLLHKHRLSPSDIKAIGSHGQTVRHQPKVSYPFTLQIADPNVIAEHTGITTIADFRRRDMASGGQGAPLTPAFHAYAFRDSTLNRVILNIGGIANITLLPADVNLPITGFDTGPGNTLLDNWIFKHLQLPYDNSGNWARTGKINESLLDNLLSDDYLQLPPPKSTGREYFNLHWLEQKLIPGLTAQDVQMTLTEFSAITIIDAINKHAYQQCQILACGGGVRNHLLIERLQTKTKARIYSTEDFNLHPDWVEAVAFAWMAKQTLERNTANLPSVTGARKASILGGIYLA